MSRKKLIQLLVVCILSIPLLGYQSRVSAQEPAPANPPAPGLTAKTNPAASRGNATNPAAQGQNTLGPGLSGQLFELKGAWKSESSNLIIKVIPNTLSATVSAMARMHGINVTDDSGAVCDVYEGFTYQDGVITWGAASLPCQKSTAAPTSATGSWITDPPTRYKVTLTTQADGSKTLLFTLDGEDPIQARKDFLDGKTFTLIRASTVKP